MRGSSRGTAGACWAHDGWPDRAQLRARTWCAKAAGEVRRGADRRVARGHRHGRDRELFRNAMRRDRPRCPRSRIAHSMEEALAIQSGDRLPVRDRPSFTLGGTGGGIAYKRAEFEAIVARGLDGLAHQRGLLEESVLGWKEFEMEVVRDKNDNCIIVCSIENSTPMGVHTGDSITVGARARR